jgi:2-dehydropantoate 2-reductase
LGEDSSVRVLVFGAGAVGQGVGGFLAASGHPTALLLRPRYRDALAQRGLRVSGVFGERLLRPSELTLATDTDHLHPGQYDVILLCVKSYDTRDSAAALERLVGEETVVVSVQNGYGNVELLARRLGKERVLCARVITGFSIPQPGEVEVTVHADDIRIGSFYAPTHPMAESLARALSEAGLPSKAAGNVEALLWEKIVYNCALNPLGAILGVHYGALGDSAHTRAVMDSIIDEVFRVIHHHGFPCTRGSADEYREAFYTRQLPATYNHRPSMLQDLASGKRTEIDALNGAIVRLGSEAGLQTPVNQTIVRIVRFLEARALTAGRHQANTTGGARPT